MIACITGKTNVLGIIGCPIEHSLSPLMQNAALETAGLDYIYVPFCVPPDKLSQAVDGLRGLGVAGFNVTIPHKTAIISLLDEVDPYAAMVGAVNTVRREGDRFIGYNTDGIGFLDSMRADLSFNPRGTTVLILGAGGAGRGAVAALCHAGASRVIIANRTSEKANEVASSFSRHFPNVVLETTLLDGGSLNSYLKEADLVANTTSVGMGGTSFASLILSGMKENAVVYDMVYSPPVTPLLANARKIGKKAANGLGMLAAQGEAAFEIWTGQKAPSGVMKARLLSHYS